MYVPVGRLDIVILVPEPEIAPGLIVQFPVGKPVNTVFPSKTAHSGCVIVLTIGFEGVSGCIFITTSVDGKEMQPTEFVTEKLYVPEVRPVKVVLEPEPAIAPGLIIQFPDGRPDTMTLPVAVEQVGCVIAPINGDDGVAGCARITMLADAKDVHPDAFVTE